MRDPLFAELTRLLKQSPRTRSEHGHWAKAISEMREAGIAPQDLAHGIAQYRAQWPNNAITPMALVKLWTAIGGRYSAAPDAPHIPQETPREKAGPNPVDGRTFAAAQQERLAARLAAVLGDRAPENGSA